MKHGDMLHTSIEEIIVLSLPDDIARREHISSHFIELGLSNYRFYDAISHQSDLVKYFYLAGKVKTYPPCFRCGKAGCSCQNNIIIPQQVANWLSFVSIWRQLAGKKGLFLICEDDVVFHFGAIRLLNSFLAKFKINEKNVLIRLGQSGDKPNQDLSDVEELCCSNAVVMSNAAYILNGSMAAFLCEKFEIIGTTSDIWLHRDMAINSIELKAITVSPLIATELSYNIDYAKFTSKIHPKGIDEEDKRKLRFHVKRVDNTEQYRQLLANWSNKMAKQWNYLASEPFQMRYLMVAGLLRKFKNILEVGSYKTPIFQFIDDESKNIVTIDPMIHEEVKSESQKSMMLDFRCLEVTPFQGEKYALVILGLDLAVNSKLKQFIANAELVIIEFPEDHQWKKSRKAYDDLCEELKFNELVTVHLNFDGNDFSQFGGEQEWPPRTQRFIKVISSKSSTIEELGSFNPFVKGLGNLDTSNSKLLNSSFLEKNIFPEAEYEFSHGACVGTNYLGGGLLYYALVHMFRPKVCVCLGSGGAFVPRLIRQAQNDLGMLEAKTILVDGNVGNFGRPNWLDENSFFKQNYGDIEVIVSDTGEVATTMLEQGMMIDYLHIDADHSYEGSLRDFVNYLPLMSKGSLITFHDTKPGAHASVTCWKALEDIKEMGHELIDFPHLGSGVAIIKVNN